MDGIIYKDKSVTAAVGRHHDIDTSGKSIQKPPPVLPDSVFKMFDMHGKVVVIMGGTGGTGYEVARGLAEAGASVSILLPARLIPFTSSVYLWSLLNLKLFPSDRSLL